MANSVSAIYYSDSAQRGQPLELLIQLNITGAKTVTAKDKNTSLVAFDAIASQSVINNFLGTTDEFLVAAFDSTAMGTDALALIVNMGGQCAELLSASAEVSSGANGLTQVKSNTASVSALTASSLSAQNALGAYGNLAARFVLTGVDALTSGVILVKMLYRIK